MIDFSWNHTLILLIVALLVVGPKDLPKLMHTVGRYMGKARRMADQLRRSFDDMARTHELDELRAEINKLREDKALNNPLGDSVAGIDTGHGEPLSSFNHPPADPVPAATPAAVSDNAPAQDHAPHPPNGPSA